MLGAMLGADFLYLAELTRKEDLNWKEILHRLKPVRRQS